MHKGNATGVRGYRECQLDIKWQMYLVGVAVAYLQNFTNIYF